MTDRPSKELQDQMIALMPKLRQRAIRLCRDAAAADDLVQETLLRAIQSQHRFELGSNLAAWLMTILRNCFLSDMRRVQRGRVALQKIVPSTTVGPDTQENSLHLRELVRQIACLPPKQRRPLMMVGVQNASYAEAAEQCGCSIGTIKSRVSRARQRLSEFS